MYQTLKLPLGTATFSAGGQATIDFQGLQNQIAGRICHVHALHFDVQATPTLTAGNATAEELQNLVQSLVITDGVRQLFNGGFKSLRIFESLENGIVPTPENDPAATTNAVNFARYFPLGPARFASPVDFVMPAPCFRGGSIQFGFGSLTQIDAACTALSATITVTAEISLHDELIFGSLYERKEQNVTNGAPISQEALYAFVGLANSSAIDAITAGDFANVGVDLLGYSEKQIHVAARERMYHAAFAVGPLSSTHGEPRAATDDNPKVANDTALAAASALVSPILWAAPGTKISKLVYAASPTLQLNWSGSQGTGYGLLGRLIPRDAGRFGSYAALVEAHLGVKPSSIKARTLSKTEYVGPRRAYMPVKAKVG